MDVKLPKIGDTAESGTVVSVLVKVGDAITAGQTILELENEKAIAPIPSSASGKVAQIRVKEGDKISVGATILTLEGAAGGGGAASPAPASTAKRAAAPKAAAPSASELAEDGDDLPPIEEGEEGPVPAASPYVRKVARELGIRLSRVRGSESGGRVGLADLARYIARLERGVARAGRHAEEPKGLVFPPVSQDFSIYGPVTSEALSPLRKTIAARMLENAVSLPHVTQFDEADLTRIEALRSKYKSAYEKAGARLSPTPFILRALVRTLQRHPRFNGSVNEVAETFVTKLYFHIGIAVDTEAGLMVPVMRDVDKKSLLQIAQELATLAEKTRERKVTADDLKGGTFTVSNQGAIGSGPFTPIINKPEVAILGLGRTALKPVVTADQRIEARPMLPLAVSYDHRVIDGGAAARFTVDLVQALQEFPEADVAL